jgi:hypothetical protein
MLEEREAPLQKVIAPSKTPPQMDNFDMRPAYFKPDKLIIVLKIFYGFLGFRRWRRRSPCSRRCVKLSLT